MALVQYNGNSVGAVTWISAATGRTGTISSANSLVGATANDQVGDWAMPLSNGNYVVRVLGWDNGGTIDAGAISLGDGAQGTSGVVGLANSVLGTVGNGSKTMRFSYNAPNRYVIVGYAAAKRVTMLGYSPEIAVQQPVNTDLPGGATRLLAATPSADTSLTFTIRNRSLGDLTGLGISIDGSGAPRFAVTANPTAPVAGPLGSTTFTVRFSAIALGEVSATLHIASNDADENPFDIKLTGRGLSLTEDTDGDGMSDAAEFKLAALGYDWQVAQPALVDTLLDNANAAELYTPDQVQALNVDAALLRRIPATGEFTLRIGLKKSTDLFNYNPFPFTLPDISVNAQGELEFDFTSPDDAAFFRVESH